jgi:hypothetical protein
MLVTEGAHLQKSRLSSPLFSLLSPRKIPRMRELLGRFQARSSRNEGRAMQNRLALVTRHATHRIAQRGIRMNAFEIVRIHGIDVPVSGGCVRREIRQVRLRISWRKVTRGASSRRPCVSRRSFQQQTKASSLVTGGRPSGPRIEPLATDGRRMNSSRRRRGDSDS